MNIFTKNSILLITILLSVPSYAAEHHIIEHLGKVANTGLLNDTWVLEYQADDFSDAISNASIIYIPADYTKQKAFFIRCKDYSANFAVQYIDYEKSLRAPSRNLPNISETYTKQAYIYDDKQYLKTSTKNTLYNGNISVIGQNKKLSTLFRTNIKKQPGMLGMSFHYSFTYREMPSFKAYKNSTDTIKFFNLFQSSLANNNNINFDLESKLGHHQKFVLDVDRLNKFAPKAVMQYCFTGRELR